MAYHAAPGISDEALAAMTHTFLIRDPLAALSSLHRRWPDFTDAEAGYDAQRALFDRVIEVTGNVPVVIDSDALVAEPDRVVAAWCERVGIDHRPESLRWEAGMRPEWQLWRDWYENAAASTGFAAPAARDERRPISEPPERVVDLVATAEHAVAPLRAHAIT